MSTVLHFACENGIELPDGLPPELLAVPCVFNNRMRTSLGRADFMRSEPDKCIGIELNKRLRGSPHLQNTFLHELAHALAGLLANHGPDWRAAAELLGAEPRCYAADHVADEVGLPAPRRRRSSADAAKPARQAKDSDRPGCCAPKK